MPSAFLADLGARTPQQLERLLTARPDLAAATPTSIGELAELATARVSLQHAIQSLNRVQLDSLERAVLLGPQSLRDDDALRALALIHPAGPGESGAHPWVLSPGVAEALGRYPAGMGRPAAVLRALKSAVVPADSRTSEGSGPAIDLDAIPPRPAEVLADFRRHPLGSIRDARRKPVPDQPEARPIDWLLAREVLIAVDSRHVELPRELGLALHHSDPWAGTESHPPTPAGRPVSPRVRDNAAMAAVPELIRDLSGLRSELGQRPLEVLRAGGVGVRERRRLAAALDLGQDRADRLLGYAQLGGLVEQDDRSGAWRPTTAPWEALEVPTAHGILLTAWLTADSIPASVGGHRADGSVITPLTDRTSVPDAAPLRRAVLTALLHSGDVAPDPAWWDRTLAWLRPRLAGALARYGAALVQECADLGLTGAGAATDLVRLLLDDGPAAVTAALRDRLPAAVETVVVQSDYTAVAHGTLSPQAAADLRLVAEPEGRGAAATYRFGVASLHRALDAGHDAASLRSLLEARTDGELPGALEHLLDEALRTHGNLRVLDAEQVVTGRADLVEAIAGSAALRGFEVLRAAPEVLIVRHRDAKPAPGARKDPLRSAVLRAAQQTGVAPSTDVTTHETHEPIGELGGGPQELIGLFPLPRSSRPEVDAEHIRTVASRLAETARTDLEASHG